MLLLLRRHLILVLSCCLNVFLTLNVLIPWYAMFPFIHSFLSFPIKQFLFHSFRSYPFLIRSHYLVLYRSYLLYKWNFLSATFFNWFLLIYRNELARCGFLILVYLVTSLVSKVSEILHTISFWLMKFLFFTNKHLFLICQIYRLNFRVSIQTQASNIGSCDVFYANSLYSINPQLPTLFIPFLSTNQTLRKTFSSFFAKRNCMYRDLKYLSDLSH